MARRISSTMVDPQGLSAFTACRLIALDKNPGGIKWQERHLNFSGRDRRGRGHFVYARAHAQAVVLCANITFKLGWTTRARTFSGICLPIRSSTVSAVYTRTPVIVITFMPMRIRMRKSVKRENQAGFALQDVLVEGISSTTWFASCKQDVYKASRKFVTHNNMIL